MSNEPRPDMGEGTSVRPDGQDSRVLEKWLGTPCLLLMAILTYFFAENPSVMEKLVKLMISGFVLHFLLINHFPSGGTLWNPAWARRVRPLGIILLHLGVGVLIGMGVYHSIHMIDFTGGDLAVEFPEGTGFFFLILILMIVGFVAFRRESLQKYITKRPPPGPIKRNSPGVAIHRARLVVGAAILFPGLFMGLPAFVMLAVVAFLVGGYRVPREVLES
ncbi:MAG: hypothetical protein JJU11_06465 [Candidatus Sumerlaeia bacterium]|nr:hypothetical protein [Candidatus Sumerlaeia bacterium]